MGEWAIPLLPYRGMSIFALILMMSKHQRFCCEFLFQRINMSFCNKWLTSLLFASTLAVSFSASADVRIDVKNESSEDCSVAFNARTDKTKWLTIGWYVFLPGEEAPVIIEGAKDYREVYIYHDCNLIPDKEDEVRKGWVKIDLKFSDIIPKEKEEGYQEVEFIRLKQNSYTIKPFEIKE